MLVIDVQKAATRERPASPNRGTWADALCSYPVLLGFVLATLVYLFLPRVPSDPDIWWHLRDVEIQLHTGTVIRQDSLSYTARGASWINHEWLAEIPYYLGWRVLGDQGLWLVAFGTLVLIFLGLYSLTYLKCRDVRSSFACCVFAVFLSTVSFGPRTLLFGWILLLGELFILDHLLTADEASFDRSACLLPPLFALWVNTHGSWLIGLVVLLAFVASGLWSPGCSRLVPLRWSARQRRTLALCTGVSACALFLNPYGWRLVAYPFDLAFRQRLNVGNVEEWQSLDFQTARGHAFILVLALLFLAQLLRTRRWLLYELALLALGTYSAFTHSRFLFLAAMLVLPLCAKDLATWLPARPLPRRPLLNAGVACAVLVAQLPLGGKLKRPVPSGENYPVQALAYLRNVKPAGNVLNDFLWGGYLVWNTPSIPVFVDSRVDIFERSGVFRDYLDLTRLRNSFALLDKYKIRYVLFRKDAPLIYVLQHDSGWKTDYEDSTSILLERTEARSR